MDEHGGPPVEEDFSTIPLHERSVHKVSSLTLTLDFFRFLRRDSSWGISRGRVYALGSGDEMEDGGRIGAKGGAGGEGGKEGRRSELG